MSWNLQELIERYHAHYEVSPYYVVTEEEHGSSKDKTKKRIQSGFEVEVYGVREKEGLELPPPEYSFGYAEIKKIADAVLQTSKCGIEVIAFPSAAFLEARTHFRPEGVIRIRISHLGDVDEPAGQPEQHALEEIEKQLQGLGITRR